jgi:hypothetical protein
MVSSALVCRWAVLVLLCATSLRSASAVHFELEGSGFHRFIVVAADNSDKMAILPLPEAHKGSKAHVTALFSIPSDFYVDIFELNHLAERYRNTFLFKLSERTMNVEAPSFNIHRTVRLSVTYIVTTEHAMNWRFKVPIHLRYGPTRVTGYAEACLPPPLTLAFAAEGGSVRTLSTKALPRICAEIPVGNRDHIMLTQMVTFCLMTGTAIAVSLRLLLHHESDDEEDTPNTSNNKEAFYDEERPAMYGGAYNAGGSFGVGFGLGGGDLSAVGGSSGSFRLAARSPDSSPQRPSYGDYGAPVRTTGY